MVEGGRALDVGLEVDDAGVDEVGTVDAVRLLQVLVERVARDEVATAIAVALVPRTSPAWVKTVQSARLSRSRTMWAR